MDSMIRDLLDFARGRLGGVFAIVPTPVNAQTLVAETVTEIGHRHPERSIAFSATSPPGDFDVEWDPDRIAQALTNLLSNAVAHGGDPIAVDAKREGEWITIEVRNAGEIPAAALPPIFAPFSAPAKDRRASAFTSCTKSRTRMTERSSRSRTAAKRSSGWCSRGLRRGTLR